MSSSEYDLVVIGGGIVGLATALQAGLRYPSLRILVLEKEAALGSQQTGHNSGVIHSGLYYQPGSLKAQTCANGAARLVSFCRQHDLPHEICGKVVVASDDSEVPALQELHRRGVANGVPGLRLIGPEELRELEPHSVGVKALHVPSTGIVDYALVALKYAELIRRAGGEIRTSAAVTGIRALPRDWAIETTLGAFHSKILINCAGLFADRVCRMAGSPPDVKIIPFRGEYYELSPERRYLVKTLIYPVPDPKFPFLGVHFTRRINGQIEAGPNAVLALSRTGYRKTDFNFADTLEMLSFSGFWNMTSKYWRSGLHEQLRSLSKRAFVRALQKLLPGLNEQDVMPSGSGVRAQAVDSKGRLLNDFSILQVDNSIHVLNVPSPAATASLAIAAHIVGVASSQFGLPRPNSP